jgi:hypothetical protein
MELNFTVTNQKIKYASNLYIVEKSRNYLTAKFSFSGSEWKNVAKTAIFKKDDTVINVLLDENGRCQVPWEVITKGTLRVSVFGGDLVTVDTADVKILKSGYEEGNAPSEPTPDVYAQILKELQLVREEAITEEVLKQLIEDWLANNEIDVLSKEDVEKIVADYIDKHKDELKGEKGTTFIPKISDEGVLSWTNDGGLPNPEPVELGGGGVPSGDYVPISRTIAGLGLSDDISADELKEALNIEDNIPTKVSELENDIGYVYASGEEEQTNEIVFKEFLPYPKDESGKPIAGNLNQILVSNGDGNTKWSDKVSSVVFFQTAEKNVDLNTFSDVIIDTLNLPKGVYVVSAKCYYEGSDLRYVQRLKKEITFTNNSGYDPAGNVFLSIIGIVELLEETDIVYQVFLNKENTSSITLKNVQIQALKLG